MRNYIGDAAREQSNLHAVMSDAINFFISIIAYALTPFTSKKIINSNQSFLAAKRGVDQNLFRKTHNKLFPPKKNPLISSDLTPRSLCF